MPRHRPRPRGGEPVANSVPVTCVTLPQGTLLHALILYRRPPYPVPPPHRSSVAWRPPDPTSPQPPAARGGKAPLPFGPWRGGLSGGSRARGHADPSPPVSPRPPRCLPRPPVLSPLLTKSLWGGTSALRAAHLRPPASAAPPPPSPPAAPHSHGGGIALPNPAPTAPQSGVRAGAAGTHEPPTLLLECHMGTSDGSLRYRAGARAARAGC